MRASRPPAPFGIASSMASTCCRGMAVCSARYMATPGSWRRAAMSGRRDSAHAPGDGRGPSCPCRPSPLRRRLFRRRRLRPRRRPRFPPRHAQQRRARRRQQRADRGGTDGSLGARISLGLGLGGIRDHRRSGQSGGGLARGREAAKPDQMGNRTRPGQQLRAHQHAKIPSFEIREQAPGVPRPAPRRHRRGRAPRLQAQGRSPPRSWRPRRPKGRDCARQFQRTACRPQSTSAWMAARAERDSGSYWLPSNFRSPNRIMRHGGARLGSARLQSTCMQTTPIDPTPPVRGTEMRSAADAMA